MKRMGKREGATVTALSACVLLSACAFGRVRPNGDLIGIAVGHAQLEHCETLPDRPPVCQRIKGGALSNNVVESVGLIGTAAAAIFAGGLTW
jgi:hypothetical protein